MSALFIHQLLTLPHKSNSREGLFLVQNGVSLCMRQNEFLFKRAAICTRFWAICSKMACVLPLNAVHFGAKRKVKWC